MVAAVKTLSNRTRKKKAAEEAADTYYVDVMI